MLTALLLWPSWRLGLLVTHSPPDMASSSLRPIRPLGRMAGAPLIYQHVTRDRDQVIARALGGLARQARGYDRDQADDA